MTTRTNDIYDFIYVNSERLLTPTSLPYESEGGHRREDAIMLLRKFYVRENNHGKYLLRSVSSSRKLYFCIVTKLFFPC